MLVAAKSRGLKHRITKRSLTIHGWCDDPPWLREELGAGVPQTVVRCTAPGDGEESCETGQGLGLHGDAEKRGQARETAACNRIHHSIHEAPGDRDSCETRKGLGVHCYTEQGGPEKEMAASNCIRESIPNGSDVSALLRSCTKQKDLHQGSKIHAHILDRGLLEHNIYLCNHLVNMYAKCGALAQAQEVFDALPLRDTVSWNALISGYAQHGQGEEALNCFERMKYEGFSPKAVTFVCALKACGSIRAAEKGKDIHAEIVRRGLLEKDVRVGTALVDMYAKCGVLDKAQEVFDELPARNVVSWNALIGGYSQLGEGEKALICFKRMKHEGPCPDAITFICTLKACGCIGAADIGKDIHADIVKAGLLDKSVSVGTALVDMYAKCGVLAKAQEVFDKLPVRNVVAWNALITGYVQHGHGQEALNCLEQMRHEGPSPNPVTFVSTLKACGSIRAMDKGKDLHAEIVREGLLGKNVFVSTAVVDMYIKCGELAKAQEVFDKLPVRDVTLWTALIAGYAEHGQAAAAMSCFKQMHREGLSPNMVTYICILKACGSIAALEKGKSVHAELVKEGLFEKNIEVGTACVDMYARCGELVKAQEVFDKIQGRDVISWSALMAAYAQFGEDDIVFNLFTKMIAEGITPDSVTFTIVLNACSRTGLVSEGQRYFETMSTSYGIVPTAEHHSCMVDLYGRSGHFDKALQAIKKMQSSDYYPAWIALLGACRKWGNVKLGRLAFEHAVAVDERNPAAYVCMHNIFAAAGMREDAAKIEAMRVKNGVWKKPGQCWWADATGNVHSFSFADRNSLPSKDIYAKLKDIFHKILQEEDSSALYSASESTTYDAARDVLCGHGEKLAIACALINTPEGVPIHVVKNTKICDDCHSAVSLISKIEKRKILVRDASRFHIFENGKCACGEHRR